MAKVFQFDKSSSNNLGARVNDFENRKKQIIQKIQDAVDGNQLIKYVLQKNG